MNKVQLPRRGVSGAWILVVLLLPGLALAHTGSSWPAHAGDLQAGWLHPVSGVDHWLAMLALGLWAGQRGGQSLWLLPTAFLTCLAAGGVLGVLGMRLPVVEPMILLSVFVFGGCIAAALRMPGSVAVVAAAGFALFHGLAHGAELPAGAQPAAYATGFMLASTALHVAGIGLARTLQRVGAGAMTRVAGLAVLATGVSLLIP